MDATLTRTCTSCEILRLRVSIHEAGIGFTVRGNSQRTAL